jgi:hypothetical protein
MALPGLGALQEILHETNRLLAAVLAELEQTNHQLEQTNNHRLDAMAAELRDLNQRLGGAATPE